VEASKDEEEVEPVGTELKLLQFEILHKSCGAPKNFITF